MESHLLQMRGLKQEKVSDEVLVEPSHLLQMRGLKPLVPYKTIRDKVASFTDAWIETAPQYQPAKIQRVASFTDAWIETVKPIY